MAQLRRLLSDGGSRAVSEDGPPVKAVEVDWPRRVRERRRSLSKARIFDWGGVEQLTGAMRQWCSSRPSGRALGSDRGPQTGRPRMIDQHDRMTVRSVSRLDVLTGK